MGLLRAHGLRPDTDLGQHFLLDENLADLAVRQAEVGAADVALEVGAGVGVLTRALARRARLVHAIEIDRRLEPALAEALAGTDNVRVIWGDATRVPLEHLEPPPTCLVANLPYEIATPIVLESLWRLPSVDRWLVMVQREVADRWLAPPGTAAYGVPSVLIGLCARPTFRRPVGPEAFVPRPRVESALVGLRRSAPGPAPGVRALVRAAFATRRKTIANALAGAGARKADVVGALEELGVDTGARAGDLDPATLAALAQRLAWTP